MDTSDYYKAAEQLMGELGVSCSSAALKQFIHALVLAHGNMNLLFAVRAKLYPAVARYYATDYEEVANNIREVKNAIIDAENWILLVEILHHTPQCRPSVGNLLNFIDIYMVNHGLWPDHDGGLFDYLAD